MNDTQRAKKAKFSENDGVDACSPKSGVCERKNDFSDLVERIRKSAGSSFGASESLIEFIAGKEKEYAQYDAKISAAEEKCQAIDQLLQTTQRNRRNREAYNNLIEKRAKASQELTLLRCNAPEKSVFYDQIAEFLESDHQQKSAAGVAGVSASKATLLSSENCTDQAEDPLSKKESAQVVLHCAERVTCGAPIYDACQFNTLLSYRVKQDQKEKSSSKALELIEKFILQDSLSISNTLDKMLPPIAFLLSRASSGVVAPVMESSNEFSGNLSAAANTVSGPGAPKKLKTVKIGKIVSATADEMCERILPLRADEVSQAQSADTTKDAASLKKPVQKKAKNTRLKIKNKDIRNMENLSIENFVQIEEREKTLEEIQVENLQSFIGKCSSANANQKRPHYEDPVCNTCNVALEIDMHNGSVSCPACGRSYDDGIENHKWHAIEHVNHSRFEYLQSSHLLLLLRHAQAKETTIIPRNVLDRISAYLDDQKIERSSLTWRKMRVICSKLDLPKYYSHVWLICYLLGGPLVVQFNEVQETEFLAVFDVLEKVYPLFKPSNSENFIFYWYIIGKTAQLLGHSKEIVRQFPMLKHQRNHMQKEKLWHKMMDHLNWPFFETAHESANAFED